MNLYHYSTQRFDVLKTKRKQGILTKQEIKSAERLAENQSSVGAYCDHISFFFERLPLDIQGSVYGKDHPVWFPGNKLFEYELPLVGLPDFDYEVVETPKKTELYYDESLTIPVYKEKLRLLNQKEGYRGNGHKELIKALRPLEGLTRECVAKANSYPNWDEIKYKYAANVPHVMIYPVGGIIHFHKVQKVVLL